MYLIVLIVKIGVHAALWGDGVVVGFCGIFFSGVFTHTRIEEKGTTNELNRPKLPLSLSSLSYTHTLLRARVLSYVPPRHP